MNTHVKAFSFVFASALGLAACSSTPPPSNLMVEAETMLNQAKSEGAEDHAATLYLTAKDHLEKGKDAVEDKEYEEAKVYLERSIADSRYAMAKAESFKAEQSAQEIEETLNSLENSYSN